MSILTTYHLKCVYSRSAKLYVARFSIELPSNPQFRVQSAAFFLARSHSLKPSQHIVVGHSLLHFIAHIHTLFLHSRFVRFVSFHHLCSLQRKRECYAPFMKHNKAEA